MALKKSLFKRFSFAVVQFDPHFKSLNMVTVNFSFHQNDENTAFGLKDH